MPLPKHLIQATLEDMVPGTQTWTVPWAMNVDTDLRCWLNTHHTPNADPGGTVTMLVVRRPDGTFAVDLTHCGDYRWDPREHVRGVPVDVL
jgi:hypothetical protein